MEYFIGAMLSIVIVISVAIIGFDRERAFYPTVLIVIASYYVLFAIMGGSGRVLIAEMLAASVFVVAAVLGFKTSSWLIAAALVGHGVFDAFHHSIIENPGVPRWWPGFCLAFDVVAGLWLAARLMRSAESLGKDTPVLPPANRHAGP